MEENMNLFLKRGPLAVFASALVAVAAQAAIPKLDTSALGRADAPQGGVFQISLGAEPEKLNPISSQDFYAQRIFDLTYDGLLNLNEDTYEWSPGLAEKYEISADGLIYTFYLRKDAKFHDGRPVTAEDVKFSFDAVKDPAFKAAHRIPYYENIASVEVVDPYKVKIITNKKYFLNLGVMASVGYTAIVPKHVFSDASKKLNKEVVGSGPYKLESYNRGKDITLVRNNEWWGRSLPQFKGKYNFDKILMRFVKEENLEIEMLKKGQLDFLGLTPEAFVKKTEGAPFGDSILKKKVENSDPSGGYNFVGWNLLNPLFKDRNVRVALAHLMNREEMNSKFRFGMSVLARGAWNFNNPFANPNIKPIEFNVEKAKTLLKTAGWEDKDKNGILEKTVDGKTMEFRFSLIFGSRDSEKYYTMYKEGLKKAGIEVELKYLEWNSFVKALDEKKFDAVSLAWGGGALEEDPKQIWHSDSARAGGSNFISYKNPEVDRMIDKAREELDKNKRTALWRKIDKLIADDAPYVFMFNGRYALFAHKKQIGMVKDTYKYDLGRAYWWMQP